VHVINSVTTNRPRLRIGREPALWVLRTRARNRSALPAVRPRARRRPVAG